MKIEKNLETAVAFETLCVGTTFVDVEYDRELWMVVDTVIDVDMRTDLNLTDRKYDGYAVNLETGYVNGFYSEEKVMRVECDTKVTPYQD